MSLHTLFLAAIWARRCHEASQSPPGRALHISPPPQQTVTDLCPCVWWLVGRTVRSLHFQMFSYFFFLFFLKQWFCLPGRREVMRVIPFAKSLTGFQNAKWICLVMTWFLSEVNNDSKENHTGWGQSEWQKILTHGRLRGMQSYHFRDILWRKSVTERKRLAEGRVSQ